MEQKQIIILILVLSISGIFYYYKFYLKKTKKKKDYKYVDINIKYFIPGDKDLFFDEVITFNLNSDKSNVVKYFKEITNNTNTDWILEHSNYSYWRAKFDANGEQSGSDNISGIMFNFKRNPMKLPSKYYGYCKGSSGKDLDEISESKCKDRTLWRVPHTNNGMIGDVEDCITINNLKHLALLSIKYPNIKFIVTKIELKEKHHIPSTACSIDKNVTTSSITTTSA
uniref:Uncharacterized protein n=1 Tax=Megaviridae environmental sample TaxID=1737588 RepID=A0A5J6VL05_9VIRU|nr:MAG: hypothetical protein [Megaviridae environmental sample]